MSEQVKTFKCSRCAATKPETEFNIVDDKRCKQCKHCCEYKRKYYKDKEKATRSLKGCNFELSDDWKEHPTIKGYYGNKNGLIVCKKTKKIIGKLKDNGYIEIGFRNDEKRVCNILAHRFIWECFYEIIEDETLVINHIDEDKANNKLENLELITQSKNTKKSTKKIHGLRKTKSCIGINQTTKKEHKFKSLMNAERNTGCNHKSIQQVCDGIYNTTTSKTSGDTWKFNYI